MIGPQMYRRYPLTSATCVFSDRFYDFNYQQSRRVDPSVRVLPGDSLLVECDYETENRRNVTMVSHRASRPPINT